MHRLVLQAVFAYTACMRKRSRKPASTAGAQFTVRNVPSAVAKAIRKRARREKKSLNRVLVEAIARAAGTEEIPTVYHDLDHIAGTWVEDEDFDAAIEAQDRVDESLWR